MLQSILNEARSLSHPSSLFPMACDCGIFETSRNKGNVRIVRHVFFQSLLVANINAPVQVTYNLEKRLVTSEDLVNKKSCIKACKLSELLAPTTIPTKAKAGYAMWMKPKQGAFPADVIKSANQVA